MKKDREIVKEKKHSSRKAEDKNGEKKLIHVREKIRDLYFVHGLSKKRIAKQLRMSIHTVIKWTKTKDQDCTEDHRGWPTGCHRRWDSKHEIRIKEIHTDLINDPKQFYCGATAIEKEWFARFPMDAPPPIRTIGYMMKTLGLSTAQKKGRHKGAAAYLCYPEYTIYSVLGERVLEADFIGQKYLAGHRDPINFISFSFKKAPKLHHYQRIDAQTSHVFRSECERFFTKYELPTHVKVDNAPATIGSASGKRNISQAMLFLLEHRIVPIFSVPRKPFSQASVEGSNSVFARRFWTSRNFTSVEDIDHQLSWFNDATIRYHSYQRPAEMRKPSLPFHPKVYFLRQVRHNESSKSIGFIDVLNEKIILPESMIHYFVLAEWDLNSERLMIFLEKEKKLGLIHEEQFPINASKEIVKKIHETTETNTREFF
jgi:hypothetical protein